MSFVASLILLTLAVEPTFEEIVGGVGGQSHERSIALMQGWFDAHSTDAQAPRALVWMAQLHLADHQPELALSMLEQVRIRYPDSPWKADALKGAADLQLLAGRYDAAIDTFDALAADPRPVWQYLGTQGGLIARGERFRWRIFVAALAALGAFVAWRGWSARHRLFPVPVEVILLTPVFILLIACAVRFSEIAGALWILTGGGVVVLWVNGAFARLPRSGGGLARARDVLVALAQAAALLYVAVIADGLWARLALTFGGGAE